MRQPDADHKLNLIDKIYKISHDSRKDNKLNLTHEGAMKLLSEIKPMYKLISDKKIIDRAIEDTRPELWFTNREIMGVSITVG